VECEQRKLKQLKSKIELDISRKSAALNVDQNVLTLGSSTGGDDKSDLSISSVSSSYTPAANKLRSLRKKTEEAMRSSNISLPEMTSTNGKV
jgi:hypothetical protein